MHLLPQVLCKQTLVMQDAPNDGNGASESASLEDASSNQTELGNMKIDAASELTNLKTLLKGLSNVHKTKDPESTSSPSSDPSGNEEEEEILVPLREIKTFNSSLKTNSHDLQTQYDLFHRIFTNQRLWHDRLSLLVILLSSTMTLMSSLTFVLSAVHSYCISSYG